LPNNQAQRPPLMSEVEREERAQYMRAISNYSLPSRESV
jgi:hypothetical protein